MRKKTWAVILSAAMLFTSAACGAKPEASAGDGPDNENVSAGDDKAGADAAETTEDGQDSAAEKQEAGDGEITHLVMAFPYWTGAPADTGKVQDAINDLIRDKLQIEVELVISDAGSYQQNITLALSGGEQLDIANGIMANYTSLATQGYLLDLNENDLLETYGQGIIDAVGRENIDACYVNGVLYGLPNNCDMATGRGCFAVATEYLDGIGYEAPADAGEIIRVSQEEMDDILAQIHEKYPEIETFRPSSSQTTQYLDVDFLGGNAFGVLLNYGVDPVVENLFTSDAYMEYCKTMYGYNQSGYMSKDAITDTTAVSELRNSHALVSYATGGKPGIRNQESAGGVPMTIFQTKEDFMASNAISRFPWMIPITSADPAAAMKLLNEFYTNPELANLLTYGLEGTHYTINDEGLLCYPDGKEGSTGYTSLQFLGPNEFICYVPEGNEPDLWEQTKRFNDNAKRSVACGFTFDATNVSNELTAVQNVYEEYSKSIEYGFVDPETAIPEMNQRMMDAGLDKIIAEKQAQLDAWLAAKSES